MKRVTCVVAMVALSAAGFLRAEERPKGPAEDGTMPALVKIAGEGELNSHAFQFLTELSDDIGSRVTGSPAERKAEEWGMAKMRAMGLENVHTEKYTIWKGWTRGTSCMWTPWAGRVRRRPAEWKAISWRSTCSTWTMRSRTCRD